MLVGLLLTVKIGSNAMQTIQQLLSTDAILPMASVLVIHFMFSCFRVADAASSVYQSALTRIVPFPNRAPF